MQLKHQVGHERRLGLVAEVDNLGEAEGRRVLSAGRGTRTRADSAGAVIACACLGYGSDTDLGTFAAITGELAFGTARRP